MKAYLPVLTYTYLHPNSSLSRSQHATKHWLTSEGYDVHFPNIAAMVRSLVLVHDLLNKILGKDSRISDTTVQTF